MKKNGNRNREVWAELRKQNAVSSAFEESRNHINWQKMK